MRLHFNRLFDGPNELIIPRLTILTDQRFFQKLVQRNLEFLAEGAGGGTDTPFVIVDRFEIFFLRDPDGIQVAADGLAKGNFSILVGFFYPTLQDALLVVMRIRA